MALVFPLLPFTPMVTTIDLRGWRPPRSTEVVPSRFCGGGASRRTYIAYSLLIMMGIIITTTNTPAKPCNE